MREHIAIYTADRDYAKLIIDDLISKYPATDVVRYIVNKMEIRVELKDGSYYHQVSPSQNSRGIKPDVSYIDIDTCSLDVIQNVIVPHNLKENFEIISSGCNKYDLDSFIDRLLKIRYIKGNLKCVQFYDEKYFWSNVTDFSVANESVGLMCNSEFRE